MLVGGSACGLQNPGPTCHQIFSRTRVPDRARAEFVVSRTRQIRLLSPRSNPVVSTDIARRSCSRIVAAWCRSWRQRLSRRPHLNPRTRDEFVPVELREWAYDDKSLSIGCGKTISFMVAQTCSRSRNTTRCSRSAPDAAIRPRFSPFSVEIIEALAREGELDCVPRVVTTCSLRICEGSRGWAEHAPFDKIMTSKSSSWSREVTIIKCGSAN